MLYQRRIIAALLLGCVIIEVVVALGLAQLVSCRRYLSGVYFRISSGAHAAIGASAEEQCMISSINCRRNAVYNTAFDLFVAVNASGFTGLAITAAAGDTGSAIAFIDRNEARHYFSITAYRNQSS